MDVVRPTTFLARCLVVGLVAGSIAGCPEPEPGGLRPARWQPALELDATVGALLAVWGPSSDEVWAVGGQGGTATDPGAGVGAVFRRQAGAWAPVALPEGVPRLNGVHGTDTRVWAVGNVGTALVRDGDTWIATDTGTRAPLWGCWAIDDDDVWAVGGDAFDPHGEAVLLHFDGIAWRAQALPPLDRSTLAMFGVWAAAADDVWAVGDAGVIVHHDGIAWSQVPSGTGNDLIGLWGAGPDQIVAVGGRSIGTVARFDGVRWTAEEVGRIAGLNAVWMHPGGNAALAGNAGGAALLYAPTFEYALEDSGAGMLALYGVLGFDDGERIAVGGSLDRRPPYVGIILESE